jgi:uncharacterized membrane protein YjjP (DUF1212 family)
VGKALKEWLIRWYILVTSSVAFAFALVTAVAVLTNTTQYAFHPTTIIVSGVMMAFYGYIIPTLLALAFKWIEDC